MSRKSRLTLNFIFHLVAVDPTRGFHFQTFASIEQRHRSILHGSLEKRGRKWRRQTGWEELDTSRCLFLDCGLFTIPAATANSVGNLRTHLPFLTGTTIPTAFTTKQDQCSIGVHFHHTLHHLASIFRI